MIAKYREIAEQAFKDNIGNVTSDVKIAFDAVSKLAAKTRDGVRKLFEKKPKA